MPHRILVYASTHSFDIIATVAFIAVAIWLEWCTMGRWWRFFFKGR